MYSFQYFALDVLDRKLPVLFRLIDSAPKSLAAVFLGQMQEELDDATYRCGSCDLEIRIER